MSKTVAQEKVPPVQQQEFVLSPVNNDLRSLEAAPPDYGESAPVKPHSMWTKLMLCFKRDQKSAGPPLSRAEKKAQKKLKKEEKALKVKAKKQEVDRKEWADYTGLEKFKFVMLTIFKFILFIVLLYLFLLSLSFMTIGFTMVTYIALKIGPIIKFFLSNPFAALAIGIIATAIMQNATATTSIAVSMVGAGIISDVKSAIPIIMGSNIGTCVTNSFIALTMAGDPNEFKRAFSAATLNDGFNLLTTTVLLPIEIIFGVLDKMSLELTNAMLKGDSDAVSGINFIASIIEPVTNLFIILDSDAVNKLASGDTSVTNTALKCCFLEKSLIKISNDHLISAIQEWSNYSTSPGVINLDGIFINNIAFDNYVLINGELNYNSTICLRECSYWCVPMLRAFGDAGTGLFWILFSIVVLIVSLFSIVKVASLIIVGPIAKQLSRALNASFPGKFRWLTQVLLFVIAFVLTLIVQSSNIITATLVPLCGIGMISLQRVYVMTLGSNIGTTITGILSAFTSPSSTLKRSMQLAFVYTFFNTLGVIFWLPVPQLRFPKRYARKLGGVVFEYRWFLYLYVGFVYFIGPLIILGLALIPNWIGLAVVGIPLILAALMLLILLILRRFSPKILPEILKDLSWLPIWMRSLKPYDEKFKSMKCFKSKFKTEVLVERRMSDDGIIEETLVEKEVEDMGIIPNMIRRFSAVDTLIDEAREFALHHPIHFTDSEDDFMRNLQFQEHHHKRRPAVHKIEPIAEKFSPKFIP